jgi:hypothetical protein
MSARSPAVDWRFAVREDMERSVSNEGNPERQGFERLERRFLGRGNDDFPLIGEQPRSQLQRESSHEIIRGGEWVIVENKYLYGFFRQGFCGGSAAIECPFRVVAFDVRSLDDVGCARGGARQAHEYVWGRAICCVPILAIDVLGRHLGAYRAHTPPG